MNLTGGLEVGRWWELKKTNNKSRNKRAVKGLGKEKDNQRKKRFAKVFRE